MQCAPYAHSGQPKCAFGDVAGGGRRVHPRRMALKPSGPNHFLRAWRKHRGYTLENVAERIGMSHQNLGKVERGRVPYTETLLDLLADVYMTDKASLIVRDPTDPDGLWSIYDALTAPERRQVVEIAKTIKRTGTDG